MVDVSIVAPAKDEAGNIEEYVERCLKALRQENAHGEILLVDDGSTDGTLDMMLQMQSRYPGVVRVFKHRKNKGLTQALKTGFANTRGKYIFWLSPDLEAHPDEDIPLYLSALKKGADVVSGRRLGRGDGKNLASKIYNFVCRKLFGIRLADMNWMKAFKRECLSSLILRGDWHRFIMIMLYMAGYKIVEVDVKWYPRTYGQSKFGLMRFPRSFVDAISIWFVMKFQEKPMRLFGAIGALSVCGGLAIHLFLFLYYLFDVTQIRPLFWTALTMELFGLQLIMFGFIAELVGLNSDSINALHYKTDTGEIKPAETLKAKEEEVVDAIR